MPKSIKDQLLENSILMEKELSNCYPTNSCAHNGLLEAQRYGLLGGGKRIRSFLLLHITKTLGGNIDAAIPYACAIEMIHASSLIHDDMPCMDNDDMRRGKASTHKAYGETLALLAGDAMLIKAFEVAINNPHCSSATNSRAVKILTQCAGDMGMLVGQALDTVPSTDNISLEDLVRLHQLKTGQLISASAQLGCLAAGIDDQDKKYNALIKYAQNVGLAFQIIDDILDFNEGKRELNTFTSFMSLGDATRYAINLTQMGIDAISSIDDGTLKSLAEYLIKREY